MTLLQLLKTSDYKMRIKIFFGSEGHYFEINDSNQFGAFIEYLEYSSLYTNDDTRDVQTWSVHDFTFTEWGKEGDRIENTEKMIFIHLK